MKKRKNRRKADEVVVVLTKNLRELRYFDLQRRIGELSPYYYRHEDAVRSACAAMANEELRAGHPEHHDTRAVELEKLWYEMNDEDCEIPL